MAARGVEGSAPEVVVGIGTLLAVSLLAVYAPQGLRRVSILGGTVAGYLLHLLLANGLGLGTPVDFGGSPRRPGSACRASRRRCSRPARCC
ncbi:hypothetical protein [Teichococcus aestuarii]|uniref:hypothetical protein n=1 Tax=Teichococcus aestuarii TaxID=568898 RepID=UPI0036131AD7